MSKHDATVVSFGAFEPEQKFVESFWGRVDQSGGPNSCWRWRGSPFNTGYGACWIPGLRRMMTAHRVAVWLDRREEPVGLQVLRHGRGCSKLCCNPAHLTVGTRIENAKDSEIDGTKPVGFGVGTAIRPELVERVNLMLLCGHRPSVIARHTGVSVCTVREIRRGVHWTNRDAQSIAR